MNLSEKNEYDLGRGTPMEMHDLMEIQTEQKKIPQKKTKNLTGCMKFMQKNYVKYP